MKSPKNFPKYQMQEPIYLPPSFHLHQVPPLLHHILAISSHFLMAQQRPTFRFRLPWIPAPAAPRPTIETTTTAQRPPFQSPGTAPSSPLPPPPAQATSAPKPETEPPTPAQTTPVRAPPEPQTRVVQPRPPPPLVAQPAGRTILRAPSPPKEVQPTIQEGSIQTPWSQEPQPKADVITTDPMRLEESKGKNEEVREKKREQEKIDGPLDEATEQKLTDVITMTADSERQTKEQEQKRKQKQGILEATEIVKATISHPKEKITTGEFKNFPLHKEIKDASSKLAHKLGTGTQKRPKVNKPASILTLAGENKGASMQVRSGSANKEGSVLHRGYKPNPDGTTEATTGGKESSKIKDPKLAKENRPTKVYINNNTQGINNSILSNKSVTESNPGVHFVLSSTPREPEERNNNKLESIETRRAQSSVTPSERLTYEPPKIRRHSVGGLSLELSESDPENPDKPHPHEDTRKDKDIDVL